MSLLRTALIHLLLIALLPWGAWMHAVRAAEAGPLRAIVAEAVEARAPSAPKSASTLTRCRISGLPGTACSFDPGHLARDPVAAMPALQLPRPDPDLRLWAKHDPAGLLDPPRRG
ncbi:hypothetical protein [Mangrovicoccus sp. HB161399]|uniref:hypothetical protein n=1 Tax=Mangrovicoccus sp. HB161399 TaxID=2720392 RepID=UPI00155371C1|nr:hypothetical protein [Mangrovicoccus sp. HB161399]